MSANSGAQVPMYVRFNPATMTANWQSGAPGSSVVIFSVRPAVQVIHVMRLADGSPVYDQILLAEQGGGIFLPYDPASGRVGLVLQQRGQTPDQTDYAGSWPNIDVTRLGRQSWELPRGFAEVEDTSGGDTATREGEEETGHAVLDSWYLNQLNGNTTFNPHQTALQAGTIDPNQLRPGDPNERLLRGLTWFSLEQLNQLRAEGDLYCAQTLAGIMCFMLAHPGALR